MANGLTKENVKYNIYAFRADAKRFLRKAERARTAKWRDIWTTKAQEALNQCQQNEHRFRMLQENPMKNYCEAQADLWYVLTHTAFISLIRLDMNTHVLTMHDPKGWIWSWKGRLATCIAKAVEELPLCE